MMQHPTFDEQPADIAMPCECWYAGRYGGMTRQQVQHPDEWIDGAQSHFEEVNDL